MHQADLSRRPIETELLVLILFYFQLWFKAREYLIILRNMTYNILQHRLHMFPYNFLDVQQQNDNDYITRAQFTNCGMHNIQVDESFLNQKVYMSDFVFHVDGKSFKYDFKKLRTNTLKI